MKALNFKNWLPHEIIFIGFMSMTLCRLMWHAGVSVESTQLYITCLLTTLTLIVVCEKWPNEKTWRLRLVLYPILIHVLYLNMKEAIPLFHPYYDDAMLLKADQWLIGGDLALKLQHLATPYLTEFLTVCYLLFFPYMIYVMVSYLAGDLNIAKKFYAGLFTIYGIGYTAYTFIPASGPYISLASQLIPLKGFWFTHMDSIYYPIGSNHADVFPSLHCAITAYLLWFDQKYAPKRFHYSLIPIVCIWFSTIYLRYHYFIDVIAGFGLALFSIWITQLYGEKTKLYQPID